MNDDKLNIENCEDLNRVNTPIKLEARLNKIIDSMGLCIEHINCAKIPRGSFICCALHRLQRDFSELRDLLNDIQRDG